MYYLMIEKSYDNGVETVVKTKFEYVPCTYEYITSGLYADDEASEYGSKYYE